MISDILLAVCIPVVLYGLVKVFRRPRTVSYRTSGRLFVLEQHFVKKKSLNNIGKQVDVGRAFDASEFDVGAISMINELRRYNT